MQTRMKKYANKRRVIELENTLHFINCPKDWLFIQRHQKNIKKVKRCKH